MSERKRKRDNAQLGIRDEGKRHYSFQWKDHTQKHGGGNNGKPNRNRNQREIFIYKKEIVFFTIALCTLVLDR